MPQQRVDIPGVGIVEFPDTMSRPEIDEAAARLHDETKDPMTWPPDGPSTRGFVSKAMESMFEADYQRPEVSPEARAAAAANAPDPRLPTATEISGGDMGAIPEPRRTQIQEDWKREMQTPMIPMSPTAEKWWPSYEGIALPEQMERGVAIGMARLAEGFTSPMTIATIGAAGVGSALSATLRVLIGVGFSGQLAAETIIKAPHLVEQVKAGQYDEAAATATEMVGTGLLAGVIGSHTLKAGRSHPLTTGRAMVVDPRVPPEPQVTFEQGRGLEVLPAHETPLFPGRLAELPGTPAAGAIAGAPETRGAIGPAPGYDIPGAGPGRLFRGGARMGEPAPTLEGEPIVTAEQTVVPTRGVNVGGLFGETPSNVARRQRQAPDFVGPPEPQVRPEPGQRLLGPGPDVALPPGGGPMVTEVRPGEPGGLEPFRQGDIVPQGRPGVPARVREPGRFPVRETGDPSSNLLADEPEVRQEGPITREVVDQATADREMTFEEAEAEGKVKVVKAPRSRWERGQQWYKENSMERDIIDEGGLKLDRNVTEERQMIMPNLGARRGDRGRNMFDPIRALNHEDAMGVDQMFEVLQSAGRLPGNWTQADFEAALTDRKPGTGGTFPMEAGVDVFDKLDAANEAQRPADFAPEAPERLVPDTGERMVPDTRPTGEAPRNAAEVEAQFQKNRQEIEAMRNNPGYAGTDFEALETQNRVIRQQHIDRLGKPKPTTIGPGFEPEVPKETVTGAELRKRRKAPEPAEAEPVDPTEPLDLKPKRPEPTVQQEPDLDRLRQAGAGRMKEPTVTPDWTEADVDTEVWHGKRKATLYALEEGGKRGVVNYEDRTQKEIATSELTREPPASMTTIDVKAEPEVKPEGEQPTLSFAKGVEAKQETLTRVEAWEAELAEAKAIKPSSKLGGPRDKLEFPMEEGETPEVQDYWRGVAEEYAELSDLVDRISLRGLDAAGRERAATVRDKAAARLDEMDNRAAELQEASELGPKAAPEATGLIVKRAEGFDQADGEWGVFRRDRAGKDAMLAQFKTETDARWWLDQQGKRKAAEEPAVKPEPTVKPEGRGMKGKVMATMGEMEYSVIKTAEGQWQPSQRPKGTEEWKPAEFKEGDELMPSGNMLGAKNSLFTWLTEYQTGSYGKKQVDVRYQDKSLAARQEQSFQFEDAHVKEQLPGAALERVERWEAGLAAAKADAKPMAVEELPWPQSDRAPEVKEYWTEVADEYQRLEKLEADLSIYGLDAAEKKRANAVWDEALKRMAEMDDKADAIEDALPDPGELKAPRREPKPKEPTVTAEGQVEIVGQKGFERENKLADDKAKLEMLLSAKPDQRTAAGRKAIKDNAKRERLLRADIAEQERLLRNEPEQSGMFAEDEPSLFREEPKVEPETTKEEKAGLFSEEEPQVQPEGKKPPAVPKEEKAGLFSEETAADPTRHASEYVDSLQAAASKPGSPITPEIAGFAKAYLNWKTGAQAESAPRLAGPMAKSVKGLIDQLIETGKPRPKGPPGQSTLYSNPVGAMMDIWSKNYGPKLHKYLMSTKEPYGLLVKPWPEFVKWLFINRHRQPPEWVEDHKRWEWTTSEGATESFKLGQQMTQKLSQADQLKLGELLRGEATEADLRAMRDNPRWNEAIDAVKVARARFDEWGSEAAVQGLLSEETFFNNYGKYMPRLYRRWEIDYDAQLGKFGAKKPTRLDMDRWKKRKDIPEEVRVLMGEIKEPGYPVAKGLSQIIHDVETAKLFNKVANHPDWTFEPEKFWDLGKDPNNYTLMPKNPRLGALSGKYVNKYIATEINQMVKARGQVDKISRALVSEWKFNKVIFNPATHGRNMVSNTMLAYLSGLPPWRVDIYSKAMMELWQEKGPHYDAAKAQGLFSSTFAKGELNQLVDAWNSTHGGLFDRIGGMTEHFAKGEIAEGIGKIRPSSTKAGQRAAKIYQGEEAWFKLAKYIHEVEKGATPQAAAAAAQKALFDYTEVPPFVEWARTSPVGAPFITFTYKALPAVLESAITHPWRLGSLVAGIYAMEEGARQHLGIEEDQLALLKRVMPDRMKGNPLGLGPRALLLPFTDKYGQLQFLDLTYILPWGDVGETGSTGILQGMPGYAGPLRVVAEIMLNKSAFTGQEIYGQNDSQKEVAQKLSDYVWKFAAPSLAPGGYGFDRLWASGMGLTEGKADYFDRVSSPGTAVASAIIGMKTNPINPRLEIFFRKKEFEDAFEDLEANAYRVRNHQGLSNAEKRKQLTVIQDKARKLRKIADTMFRGPMSERE